MNSVGSHDCRLSLVDKHQISECHKVTKLSSSDLVSSEFFVDGLHHLSPLGDAVHVNFYADDHVSSCPIRTQTK